MNSCLAPVITLPGEKPEIRNEVTRLLAEAEKFEKAKEQKVKEAKTYEQQLEEMSKLFADAEAVQEQGYAFKAIKKYKLVINRSDLPDPKNLKSIASERIEFIEQKIKEKSEGSLSSAEALFTDGNIKGAIITLREAKIYDPGNKNIQEKIENFSMELKKRVRTIYQESIIDENYGVIENTETSPGAMEKWKKITEMDLEDGEYFRKAVTK